MDWTEVEVSVIEIDFDIEGEQYKWYDYEINYDNKQSMTIRLSNSNNGVILKFTTTWNPDGIQRKDTIEEVMVNQVLNDMAKIQGIIEGRLKLKKYGFDVDSASIDCHFDATTFSLSIKMTVNSNIINVIAELFEFKTAFNNFLDFTHVI